MQFSLLATYYFEELISSHFRGFIHQLTPRSKKLRNHFFIYAQQTLGLMGKERGIVISHPTEEEIGGDQSPDFLRWWQAQESICAFLRGAIFLATFDSLLCDS